MTTFPYAYLCGDSTAFEFTTNGVNGVICVFMCVHFVMYVRRYMHASCPCLRRIARRFLTAVPLRPSFTPPFRQSTSAISTLPVNATSLVLVGLRVLPNSSSAVVLMDPYNFGMRRRFMPSRTRCVCRHVLNVCVESNRS